MDFMLAKPLDTLEDLANPQDWLVEDKYDGFRSQIHAANGRVMIFTRGMKEVTGSFPELVEAFQSFATGSFSMARSWRGKMAGPVLQLLQQRIARRKVTQDLISESRSRSSLTTCCTQAGRC